MLLADFMKGQKLEVASFEHMLKQQVDSWINSLVIGWLVYC